MSTSTINSTFDAVCDALRDVHDEASLWKLSDEIVRVAPNGVSAVDAIVEQAKARGIPTKSTNTLRLYRDVAIRFPQAERVPLVSFSAHREAIAVGDVKQAHDILVDLAAKHGAEGVTVTTVKQAIGAVTGKVSKPKASAKAGPSYADVALDLEKGGKKFVAELDALIDLPGVSLDGLHAGLTTVLAQVESRRSKAARKAQAAAKRTPSTPVDPKRSPAARKARATADAAAARNGAPAPKAKVGAAKVGDLRDL